MVEISPDGKYIVSGSADKTIKLWNIQKEELVNDLHGHKIEFLSITFSPDGKYIASGSADKTIKLWNIQKNKLIHTFVGHRSSVYSVKFSPDGKSNKLQIIFAQEKL